MSMELAKGVHVHVFPTQKYKTVHIKLKFSAPLVLGAMTERALLSNILETNSKKYPTQTALRNELSRLYGARFGTSAGKKGTKHIISVEMSLVNDKFLGTSENVLQNGVTFLKEVLLSPHVEDEQFHHQTFIREKENLKDVYESYYDDKQLFAGLALQELYFDDPAQQIPGTGTPESLEKIDEASLYAAYKKMIHEDTVDIYVLGDVVEEDIQNLFSEFGFADREDRTEEAFYTQPTTTEIRTKTETQPIAQAKLNLGYQTTIYYHGKDYYAGQVFNGLFGGFPHSKLFMNVREKESLAYYASSSIDTFRGMLTVQTGIEASQAEKVKQIIQEQLEELQKGNLDAGSLAQTKEMLINQLYQSEDSPSSVMERDYAMKLAQTNGVTLEQWIQGIKDVTVEEIKRVASNTQLQAVYLLKGE